MVQSAFNSEGIFGLVASRMGITILNESMLNYHRKGLVMRYLKDCEETSSTLAVWSTEGMSPLKQRFVDFLRDQLRDLV